MKYLFVLYIMLNLAFCGETQTNSEMEDKNEVKRETIEVESTINPIQTDLEYDYVVSEAAVGNYGGVSFTVDGIYKDEEEGEVRYTTTIDIEKQRFVDLYEGTEFDLSDDIKLKVVRIEYMEEPKKGKIYFKRINKD